MTRFVSAIRIAAAFALAAACTMDETVNHAGDETDGTIELFRWHDFEFDAPTASGNLFDVTADVVWSHGDGRTVRHGQAFYTGTGNRYAFRFGAGRVGRWAGVTRSPIAELDGRVLSITVVPPSNPERAGFHVVLPDLPTAWAQQTGSGARIRPPRLVMWDRVNRFWDDIPRTRRDVDVFADRHGFTGAHVTSIAANWFDVTRTRFRIEPADTNPDPRTFRALEALIDAWLEQGGSVHIWAFADSQRRGSPLELTGGPDGPVARRLDRYIAARLGPVPGWSMGYGFDLQEWATPSMLGDWIDRVTDSGWHHWVGGRFGQRRPPQPVHHGGVPPDGVHMNSVRSSPPQYAGWEHWGPLATGPHVPRDGLAALPDRPQFSEDRFRLFPNVRRVNRRQHFVSEAAQLEAMERFGMAGVAAVYGRYFTAMLHPAGISQTSQTWPNPAAVKAVNLRIDAFWEDHSAAARAEP